MLDRRRTLNMNMTLKPSGHDQRWQRRSWGKETSARAEYESLEGRRVTRSGQGAQGTRRAMCGRRWRCYRRESQSSHRARGRCSQCVAATKPEGREIVPLPPQTEGPTLQCRPAQKYREKRRKNCGMHSKAPLCTLNAICAAAAAVVEERGKKWRRYASARGEKGAGKTCVGLTCYKTARFVAVVTNTLGTPPVYVPRSSCPTYTCFSLASWTSLCN